MKFKAEVGLLSLALVLFFVSAFFYSYQAGAASFAANLYSYPYQGYSIVLTIFGSVLTAVAFVSYSRRGKSIYAENFDISADDKSH